jgi:hypothetical protein
MQPGMKSGFTAIETTTKPSIEMKEAAHEAAYSAFARFKCSVVNPKKRTAAAVSVVRNSRRQQRLI